MPPGQFQAGYAIGKLQVLAGQNGRIATPREQKRHFRNHWDGLLPRGRVVTGRCSYASFANHMNGLQKWPK